MDRRIKHHDQLIDFKYFYYFVGKLRQWHLSLSQKGDIYLFDL
ncbi:hypothetical protein FORC066_1072 [Yersinia enterocolitica]|nr:hypothetical protein FORC066_1072 [Yersinia enterocolitica]